MINAVEMKSGVRLVMEKIDNVKSVSIGIWCNTGSVNEPNDVEGISHYIEHMLFKGTTNRSTFDIVHEIDRIGGQMNAFTGKENTCFYIKCMDEHFEKSADVLVDMISNPLFDEDEMEKEKKVVIEEINMNQDDPDDVALDNLENVVFANTRMEHPVLGSKETVSAVTQEKIREYYYNNYTKDSIVVSVAGSFDENAVIEYFESKFNNLKESKKEIEKLNYDYVPENKKIIKDIEQAHIAMGLTSINANDDRRFALAMLNNLFGGNMSSRLFQNVREKKGLAYSVYSMLGYYVHGGIFVISAGVSKTNEKETLEAIKEELQNLKNERISEQEFSMAKEQLKASYIFSLENVQSRMINNGRNIFKLGRCPSQEETIKNYNDVTIEDLENIKSLIADYDSYSIINVTGKVD